MDSDQKRLVLALVLSGLVIMIWQAFFVPQVEITPSELHKTEETSTPRAIRERVVDERAIRKVDIEEEKSFELEETVLERNGHRFTFLNDLSIRNIISEESVFDFQSIAGGELPFRIQVLRDTGAEDLYFEFETLGSSTQIRGEDKRFNINLTAEIFENGKLDFALSSPTPFRYRFVFDAGIDTEVPRNQMREFIYLSSDVSRIRVGKRESGEAQIKWFGLDYNYHLFAFVLAERGPVLYESTVDGKLIIDFVRPTHNFVGDLVFTKKLYDRLVDLGDQLSLSVNFGFIGVIAVPMLRSLQWFYQFIPNYGVAIILLTLVIRMLLFPLSYASFKSMKKMQKLAPELTKLREKYKDEPQKMQKETMELFKKSGANPLGGCLPLLLQMPIFFAFYRMLYGAVELVNAPFIWWIQDLSIKDPFYILPLLMAILMFLQQKLMPSTTMDPMQRKILMFLPIIFGFIMKDFPAGLNLYIAVSTFFGILQQIAVYRMTD